MQQFSEPTNRRLAALERFGELTGSSSVVLWLTTGTQDERKLLLSYSSPIKPEEKNLLFGKTIKLGSSDDVFLNSGTSLTREFEQMICMQMTDAESDITKYSLLPLVANDRSSLGVENLIGVICFDGETLKDNRVVQNAEAHYLASCIENVRYSRISEAVLRVQDFVQKKLNRVDPTLARAGLIVAQELGARGFAYRNTNTNIEWLITENNTEELVQRPVFPKPEIDAKATLDPDGRVHWRSQIVNRAFAGYSKNAIDIEALLVPLWQDSYKLQKSPFLNEMDFRSRLEQVRTPDVSLVFFDKFTPGYLQHCFSDTDQRIAEHVFGYIEHYATNAIFEENYTTINDRLKSIDLDGGNVASQVQSLLTKLSIAFANTHHLVADYSGPTLDMQLVSANNTSTIEPQYIERLKNNYLKKIEVNGADIVGESEMKIGIEPTPAGFLIEFHLPGDGISSNLFILEYAYATVTQSIFKSCVVYFNELHLKYKKRHNNFDRISYPLQVRHAVIHHFTAAAKGMLSLRPMWDRGRKSHEYWGSLLSNPIISDQLTRSIWSLGQAQILMDNSRFLFADISKLSRKNYRIKNVVNNCLQVLADQRQEKSIRVISRIKVLIFTEN